MSEGQAGHGEQERKICPLYKAAAIISAKGLGMPVTCDGRSCGMWALCQARIDLSGKDIKLTPPAVPGP